MKRFFAQIDGWFSSNSWLWFGGLCGVVILHFGTAILRLNSFFPSIQALDFSTYYAAAWALRLHQSPYTWSKELFEFLAETQGLPRLQIQLSPPLWPLLLQPLTLFSFPTSAILWLLILLLIVLYCHLLMVRMAGYTGWKIYAVTLPFTLTFGPLFLNLTLGQNGVFLLLGVLLLGESVKRAKPSLHFDLLVVVMWAVAFSAKIYPILWMGALLLLGRWRMLVGAGLVGVLMFGGSILLAPQASAEYWLDFLPNQTRSHSTQVSIEDQSLGGFLSRVGRGDQYVFPGLSVSDRLEVSWSFPWEFSVPGIQAFSLVLLLLLGVWLTFAWIRSNGEDQGSIVYALALFSLLPFPHMDRYNHILALPAIAWLWERGGRYRHMAVVGYGLFGLSRLNHFWAAYLPSPLGPIATGFGLFGVLLLLVGIAQAIGDTNSTPRSPQWGADRPGE